LPTNSTTPPFQNKNPYDRIVQHAINSQADKFTHRGSAEISTLDESTDGPTTTHPVMQPLVPVKPEKELPEEDLQRQWAWSVAEEMMPDSKEERASQILEEVGRMEVFLDNVADRVKIVKEQLDHLESEGGPILHLKDSQ